MKNAEFIECFGMILVQRSAATATLWLIMRMEEAQADLLTTA